MDRGDKRHRKQSIGVHQCGCVGPQNGEPLCPCMMRGVRQRNGRWIRPEEDLGPVHAYDKTLLDEWAGSWGDD